MEFFKRRSSSGIHGETEEADAAIFSAEKQKQKKP